jgi:two-component system nitrogen regulation sensor histidine kinase NtrY|tara:strand:- start:4566 stop:6329 length:1764 start_codon:yes stop_codon:yes gene_type:complete
MIDFIKRNIFILLIFFTTLLLGFITFFTFLDKSFINLNQENLKNLLYVNIIFLILFFVLIFKEISNSIKSNINVKGSIANRKYIVFFSLFTLIPSLLISVFSLFIFSFALDKYFDQKITTAVNNSYELAKNYVNEKRNKIESDIVLAAFDLNKNIKLSDNKPAFQNYLNNQRILRGLDQLHLINSKKELIMSAQDTEYMPIDDRAINMVLNDDRPLKIINAFENYSGAIIKLPQYNNLYLYVIKYLDKDISKYLQESEEAINFYYTVEDQSTGIKISFALIYVILVTLLLFLSITIAIRFSSRFFVSINNLITASELIGKGDLNTKVPDIKTDTEMEKLNSNFNSMIAKLKDQQQKLINSERMEAWETIARKLAHEIKNPLTPIQLTIDNLRSKYLQDIKNENKEKFEINLKTINNQINQIESLVNEFSDFARMPKPVYKKNNLKDVILLNIELLKKIGKDININFNSNSSVIFKFDHDQISRVCFNLIKNSIESLKEKSIKTSNFVKNIDIEIDEHIDYISLTIIDSGIGFENIKTSELTKPYFTTKADGTGLGLSIVNKIINDHNGVIKFTNLSDGAKIEIKFYK